MIIIRPLIKVLSKIMELPKGSFLDPTTLGSGNPDGTNFLRGDSTWVDPFAGAGYVPYVGATEDVDLGEFELKAGQIEFDQSPTGTAGVAVMRWNNTDGTLDLGLKGGNVTLQVGQEQVARVVNKTSPLIDLLESNYQAVRIYSATGQRLSVRLARADIDANSASTLGLVTETINQNQEGFITTSGQVREINTTGSLQGETWVDGDILYLSGTTFGSITNVKPAAPIHTVIVGYVEYAHAIHGKIFVKVDNGYELDELHNVYINPATLADNNLIQYDSSTSLWKNESLSTAGIQPTLVSGTSIKTINTISLLGSGDITIGGGGITVGTTAVTLGTIGRVFFQGTGNVVQQSASLFWDNTNARLGVGATPSTTVRLDVRAQGALSTDIAFRVRNSADSLDIIKANGRGDVFIGQGAGRLTTGAGNVFMGINAGVSNITGQENTAIGNGAGVSNLGSQNTYLGASAGGNGTTASASVFIGYQAGQNSNASNGIFIGQTASTTGGNGTVAIGYNAGAGTGSHNLSLGQSSGIGMTTGSFNTHLGYRSVGSGVTTGNYNNLLGSDIVVGAVSNTAVLADNQGNIAIRKDASHFVGVGYSGTATLGAKLDIKAQGALVTNLALRVRNSADTSNLFVVKGNGVLNAASLPTSSAGLVAGDIWNNLGILSIV